MHELAICESVVATVTDAVGAARVLRVVLEIGKLSAVVPDSIRFSFDLCASGTPVAGAALEIVETPGRGRCRDCRCEVPLQDLFGLCSCGGAQLEVIAGQELRIRSVEVV
jgi:hydrogenase nickel incorporation protein HypA/HybF